MWGRSDVILFVFGGASAEFALNKAVDWLYFTGRLPADPLARLFSTVTYARLIVFSEEGEAHRVIDQMRSIHTTVEKARQSVIPDWAYRDVLFLLIYYSIASFELLERKLTPAEKQEVYEVFERLGTRMGLQGLPENYTDWLQRRQQHLAQDLQKSPYTVDLYRQYRKHLGWLRYYLLKEAQKMVVPESVRTLLNLGAFSPVRLFIPVYKLSRKLKIDWFLVSGLLPPAYKAQIKALNVPANKTD